MACIYICDGCNKKQKASHYDAIRYTKPNTWYQRADKNGIQDACSRKCIEIISKQTGKTNTILPI